MKFKFSCDTELETGTSIVSKLLTLLTAAFNAPRLVARVGRWFAPEAQTPPN